MINFVVQILLEEGCLEDPVNIAANVILGRSVNIQVFDIPHAKFYNIKLSKFKLDREYRGLLLANSTLPGCVPVVICRKERNGFDLLISRGEAFDHVRKLSPSVIEFVQIYFKSANIGFVDLGAMCHRRFLQDIGRTEHLDEWQASLEVWLSSSYSRFIDRMPRVAQHGDFFLLNLGVSSGRYIIFDWEDFGRVCLAGYDVIMLAISALEFKPGPIKEIIHGEGHVGLQTLLFCLRDYLDISNREFGDLVKICLLIFLFLKKSAHYHASLVDVAVALLRELGPLSVGKG